MDVMSSTIRVMGLRTRVLTSGAEGHGTHHDVVAVHRIHIVLVIPESDGAPQLVAEGDAPA